MADDAPAQQQVQLRIDESKMTTTYSNTIRTSTTTDEVVMDFGFNMPMQLPGQPPMVVFSVGSRVLMNWAGAKRLAMTLGGVIQQYEAANGEIQVPMPQQQQQAPDAAPDV